MEDCCYAKIIINNLISHKRELVLKVTTEPLFLNNHSAAVMELAESGCWRHIGTSGVEKAFEM